MSDSAATSATTPTSIRELLDLDENAPEYRLDAKHRLFVYGTLKRGFGNSPLLRRAAFHKATQTIDNTFLMLDFGGVPGIFRLAEGNGHAIYGELYEIDGIDLFNCDVLEGNGLLYKRELVKLSGVEEPAWMYLLQVDPHEMGFCFDGVRIVKLESQEQKALIWLGEYAEQFDNQGATDEQGKAS